MWHRPARGKASSSATWASSSAQVGAEPSRSHASPVSESTADATHAHSPSSHHEVGPDAKGDQLHDGRSGLDLGHQANAALSTTTAKNSTFPLSAFAASSTRVGTFHDGDLTVDIDDTSSICPSL